MLRLTGTTRPPPGETSGESSGEPGAGPDEAHTEAGGNRKSSQPGNQEAASMGAAYDASQPYCTFLGLRVACGPLGLPGARDALFHNNGDGTFEEVTRQAGVEDIDRRYGFSVAWVDLDDDGWLDLVVANDSKPNLVYHNQGDGTSEETGLLSGLATDADGREQAYMGMAIGDYDRDGRTSSLQRFPATATLCTTTTAISTSTMSAKRPGSTA